MLYDSESKREHQQYLRIFSYQHVILRNQSLELCKFEWNLKLWLCGCSMLHHEMKNGIAILILNRRYHVTWNEKSSDFNTVHMAENNLGIC